MSKEKIDLRPVLWKVGVAVALSFAGLNIARFRDRKKNKPSSPTPPPHSSGPSQKMITDVSETSIWEWDVFLSFRGPDTRHKFTDHLYHNLIEKNIRVFRDAEGIPTGDEISPSLVKAIERSRLSVVIFSKAYVSSDSCLDELVTILKCKEERKQRVIPIFYEVDPSELRYRRTGVHEQKYGKDRLQNWTSALEEASELKGESYVAGYEYEFLEKIVNQIMSFLGPNKVLLGKLESSLKFSNMVLDDVENKEITDHDVKLWLDELKDVVYDAEDLLAYDSHAIASNSSSIVVEVEEKLKEILNRLGQLKEEMEKLGLGDCDREVDMYGHNLPVERDGLSHLNGLGVIAVVGMGGLGKTTLAQLVYCQKEVSDEFQLRAWICVSEETDVFLVTKNP